MKNQIITSKAETILFGKKHNGETVRHILLNDAQYILWLDEKGIFEFSEEIIEEAEDKAEQQHTEWLKDNYSDGDMDY